MDIINEYSNDVVALYHSLNNKGKAKFLETIDDPNILYKYPEFKCFKQQLIEDDIWRYYILLASRSFGKSYTGSVWMARKVLNNAKILGLVSPTYNDLIGVTIPLLKSHFPQNECNYNKQDKILTFKNYPAIIYCYSSETEIRGPSLEAAWLDELAKWCDSIDEKIQEKIDILDFAVRVGNQPQIIITTTPKNLNVFKNFVKQSTINPNTYKLKNGILTDNPFLPKSYVKAMIDKYSNTRFGRQELFGEIIEDVEGALFDRNLIEQQRISTNDYNYKCSNKEIIIKRIIVAIDPAVTSENNSDETGIIVAALSVNNRVYILEDASGKYTPHEWAVKAVNLYDKYKADRIIAEKNNGGDLVGQNIKTVSRNVPIKLVHASKGKLARAEPVQSLYMDKRVYHVGSFPKLEDQMCSYTGNTKDKSPDRMDAAVWAVTELLLNNTTANRDLSTIGYF